MLNLTLGEQEEINGQLYIRAEAGKEGHAVYGPYTELSPGRYVVGFDIAAGGDLDLGHVNCASIDVVIDNGQTVLASTVVKTADIAQGNIIQRLEFVQPKAAIIQYRVHAYGLVPLLIAERRPVRKLEEGDDAAAIMAMTRLPHLPDTLKPTAYWLHRLYGKGADIAVSGDDAIMSISGVKIFTSTPDDIMVTEEVFYERVYQFECLKPVVVIDIGMNLGQAALLFAAQPNVAKVYGYEPFRATFDRALKNFQLNPRLASKIVPHCAGLSDYTAETEIAVRDSGLSGAMRIIPVADGGVRHRLHIKDAAQEIGPIIKEARRLEMSVVLKVDCEGSEYAVFDSLHAAGLFRDIAIVMAETHLVVEDKKPSDLTDILKQHRFAVFDRSPPGGNGMLHAVRMASDRPAGLMAALKARSGRLLQS